MFSCKLTKNKKFLYFLLLLNNKIKLIKTTQLALKHSYYLLAHNIYNQSYNKCFYNYLKQVFLIIKIFYSSYISYIFVFKNYNILLKVYIIIKLNLRIYYRI